MISWSNPRGKCTYFLYPTKHRRPCKDVESFKYSLTKSNYHISLVLTASLVTIIPLEQQVACKEKFPNLTDIWRQASEQKSIWSCGISLPLGIKCRAQLLFFFNIPATKFFISLDWLITLPDLFMWSGLTLICSSTWKTFAWEPVLLWWWR